MTRVHVPSVALTPEPQSDDTPSRVASPANQGVDGLPHDDGSPRYLNREMSWLAFNDRVLREAENPCNPLLERVRFLSICDSNLAEFFCVRVAGLKSMVEHDLDEPSLDGKSAAEQLVAIDAEARHLVDRQQQVWQVLRDALSEEGLAAVEESALTPAEQSWLDGWFAREIFPALTPLAVDPAHPFPLIQNQCGAMLLELEAPKTGERSKAIVPFPPNLPRYVRLPSRPSGRHARRIAMEHLLPRYLGMLFPSFEVRAHGWFDVLRDTELEFSDGFQNLIEMFRTALEHRRHGQVIRLMVDSAMAPELRAFLLRSLPADERDVFEISGLRQPADLREWIDSDRPDLLFAPYAPRYPERIAQCKGDYFTAIRRKDILVHHPYETFDTVVDFLKQAAEDPDVVAIKQTLYRTSDHSPIVSALVDAARNGKSVTALIELKARFDEAHNIHFARQLERAGVQVVYGFLELKTHAKLSLVVRRERGRLRAYAHFGTGNYHPLTAKVYTDLSLFTCDEALCRDAGRVFNYLTGYAHPNALEKLAVSPIDLLETLIDHIDAEAAHAGAGRPSGIWAKLNALVEPALIDALYRASQAGVPIHLVVRGICCLRPGVPGLSENIRVQSIIGRYLEHARVVAFGNGAALPSAQARVYMSSADWMPRNMHRRIEALVPIDNPTVQAQVLEQILMANLKDTARSWVLRPDGSWRRIECGNEPFCAHDYLMAHPSLSGRGRALTSGPPIPHLTFDSQFPAKRRRPRSG